MSSTLRIGIIGDYDGRPSHIATEQSLKHCANRLRLQVESEWIPTVTLEEQVDQLESYDGLWCAPGSPYNSMLGALRAIQYAREHDYPFIGTCGGFQHAVIEYGKNVLHIETLQDSDFDPYSPNLFITALSCSLVGQARNILLNKNTKVYDIYNEASIEERYNCNFGLNKELQMDLDKVGFKVVGADESGEARIMMIEENRFFVATLFQPQLSSTYDAQHPLLLAYLDNVYSFKKLH